MKKISKILLLYKSLIKSATIFYVEKEGPDIGPRSARASIWGIIFLFMTGILTNIYHLLLARKLTILNEENGQFISFLFVVTAAILTTIIYFYLNNKSKSFDDANLLKLDFRHFVYLSIFWAVSLTFINIYFIKT